MCKGDDGSILLKIAIKIKFFCTFFTSNMPEVFSSKSGLSVKNVGTCGQKAVTV